MKVLMINGSSTPGGATVQAGMTAVHLRRLGVEVEMTDASRMEFKGCDVIHSFNGNPALLRQLRRNGLPIVLSTIYWSVMPKPVGDGFGTRLKHFKRVAGVISRMGYAACRNRDEEFCRKTARPRMEQRAALEMVDLLLPNSRAEGMAMEAELGVTTPWRVVPNAADPSRFNMDGDSVLPGRTLVVYSGRIEPRKNQLGLIQAMKGMGLPLWIVGPTHQDHEVYVRKCQAEIDKTMRILPAVSHDQLVKIYRSAKVHVLPSYGETTGLSSLEAALCGANIVTTDRYFTRDYFGDLAWYCQYHSRKSIRQAVMAAYESEWRPQLRQRILDNYTWEHTAQATLEAYRSLI